MTTSRATSPRVAATCQVDGCEEPRHAFASGRRISLCLRHETERKMRYQHRKVEDEAGNLVDHNTLRNRRWRATRLAKVEP